MWSQPHRITSQSKFSSGLYHLWNSFNVDWEFATQMLDSRIPALSYLEYQPAVVRIARSFGFFQVADSLFGEFDENKPYEVCKEGNCGGAYLKVAGPGKNMISKELKAKGLIDTLGSSYGWDMSVDVGRRGSQSADRMEAAAIAYGNVLKKYGVPNRVKTYLT